MFKGSITALITPFRDGAIDEDAFRRIVNWQISEGTDGLVPGGTTGESATLSGDEHVRLFELTVEAAAGRVPVIAGCGSNDTRQTLDLAGAAKEAGADALLIVAPYYNRPNQEGLFLHFKAINDGVGLPFVAYNIPGRTGVDIAVETMARMARELEYFVAIKDATGDLARVAHQRGALGGSFCQLSGEDLTALAFNAMGGVGCISVTANVAPKLCSRFQEACLTGDYAGALLLQDSLAALHGALFIDTSPVPVKFAASMIGLCEPDVRLPLAPLGKTNAAIVASALANCRIGPVTE